MRKIILERIPKRPGGMSCGSPDCHCREETWKARTVGLSSGEELEETGSTGGKALAALLTEHAEAFELSAERASMIGGHAEAIWEHPFPYDEDIETFEREFGLKVERAADS